MLVFSLFVIFLIYISLLALSTENSAMNTWSGTRPSHSSKQMKTGSRARHMSDYVSVSFRSLQTDLNQLSERSRSSVVIRLFRVVAYHFYFLSFLGIGCSSSCAYSCTIRSLCMPQPCYTGVLTIWQKNPVGVSKA